MVCDAFGQFRGWCRAAPDCLEYMPAGAPEGPADAAAMRCSRCRCMPQQHVAVAADGYDPHGAEHLAARRRFDERLQPAEERAARHKAEGDAAFRAKNYRTAYQHYTTALEATPDDHVVLSNRCQTYLKVSRHELALSDGERLAQLAPTWPKAHYRLGCCLRAIERFGEAVGAFQRACELEPGNKESASALASARKQARAPASRVHSLTRRRASGPRTRRAWH